MSRASSPSAGSESDGFGAVFEEPADFRPPTPPPTVRAYKRRKYGGVGAQVGADEVDVGLVSGHPLWGHILYPAAIAMARFLELHAATLLHGPDGHGKGKGKAVLELGAGGGLPGLTAALEGAGNVVISDFPDASLVRNLEKNVELNVASLSSPEAADTCAKGFTWGSPPDALLESLSTDGTRKFDLILLSDLVFNHSQHAALLASCLSCLSTSSSPPSTASEPAQPAVDLSTAATLRTPAVLCFFSHHRPWLVDADLGIVKLAEEGGWACEKVWEDPQAGPAFPEDGGDLAVRSTVHGWMFTRKE
ncbi:Protein N-terminal and lysine N-methyltransferase efm7 [Rhodotorula kratochvilovae]